MSFTYSETLETSTDQIRALLGDTDEDNALFSDEHIGAAYTLMSSDMNRTTSYLANELVSRFARNPIRWTAEGVSVDMSSQIDIWQSLSQVGGSLSFVPATYGAADTPDEYAREFRNFPSYRGPS